MSYQDKNQWDISRFPRRGGEDKQMKNFLQNQLGRAESASWNGSIHTSRSFDYIGNQVSNFFPSAEAFCHNSTLPQLFALEEDQVRNKDIHYSQKIDKLKVGRSR